MSRLVETIKARFNELGQEKTKRVLREFAKYPFVDGDLDYPRLYSMVMSQLELQNPAVVVQETQRVIIHEDDDEDETADTASSAEKPMNIDLHKKVMEEQESIKGKKPISVVPPTSHNHEKKQKLLHDAIKSGEKRARRSDEDYDDYDHHQHQEKAIPEELKQIMAREKGNEAVLVIQKKLSQADVDPHNECCLSIPISRLGSSFLSQIQKEEFLFQKVPRIEGKLVEPNGSVSEIYLTRLNTRGGDFLNLVVSDWKDVVKRNRLREGMEMQVWSFLGAGSQQLWLALFRV